jgi:hypothetical protein
VEAARIAWRPLGRLLVEQGLLTDDELERALALQQASGKRLGETIVDLGFVSGPDLASALATQYGIVLTMETGFGTGLRAEIQRRHENDRGLPGPPVLSIVETPHSEPEYEFQADDRDELAATEAAEALLLTQLEEQWAKLAAAEAALAESERELAEVRRERDRKREQSARFLQRLREREHRLEQQQTEIERLQPEEHPEPEVALASSHLVFVQLDGGYELLERAGAAPELNSVLTLPELCEDELVVTRLGRSPLPADARACIFVQRAEPLRS